MSNDLDELTTSFAQGCNKSYRLRCTILKDENLAVSSAAQGDRRIRRLQSIGKRSGGGENVISTSSSLLPH